MAPPTKHRTHERPPTGRRLVLWAFAAALAALAALLLAAAPALALPQRGHQFCDTCTFGGGGEGALSKPGGIAVSDATGDVYVLDRRHDRIVQYSPAGQFLSAWGWGVKTGSSSKRYEVCQSKCHPGIAGRGEYQLNSYTLAIAVDNCTQTDGEPCTEAQDPSVGDVYVVKEYADKKQAAELKKEENEKRKELEAEEKQGKAFSEDEREAREHVFSEYAAVDKFAPEGGALEEFAYDEKACEREKNEPNGGPLACELELETEDAHGLTIAPDGTVWLYYEEELLPFSDAHLSAAPQHPPLSGFTVGEPPEGLDAGLAEDTRGHFYIAQQIPGPGGQPLDVISAWETVNSQQGEADLEEVTQALDEEDTTAVATATLAAPAAERNDVYITNLTGAAGARSTTLAQFAPDGSPLQRLGAPGSHEGAGIAVDARTRELYLTDAAADDIDVFKPEQPSPPTIEALSAQDVSSQQVGGETQVRAQLDATIDPRGAVTAYHFSYGTARCTSAPSACAEVPGGQFAGAGFADEGFGEQQLSVQLGAGTAFPLAPSATYHYRAVASNALGQTTSAQEGSFSTPPAKGNFSAEEREWEMVSPPDKDGAGIEAMTEDGGVIQAAQNGSAIAYISDGPFGEAQGSRSLERTQVLSARTSQGWSSQDIVTANDQGTGIEPQIADEYRLFSPTLALSLLQPFVLGGTNLEEPPLSPPVTEAERGHQEKTIYLRNDRPRATTQAQTEVAADLAPEPSEQATDEQAADDGEFLEPGYLALLTAADVLPQTPFGHQLSFVSATPDLTHVLFRSVVPLLAGAGENGLYEWSEDRPLQLVATGGDLGYEGYGGEVGILRDAISGDGSRVFWSQPATGQLYMWDASTEKSVRLDSVQGGSGEGEADAVFQTASADGARVFFTDTQQLTAGSGAAKGSPDLYVCEITETAGEPACQLSDLTPRSPGGEGAAVRGLVIGAGEDGSSVYFLANGVLSPAAAAAGASEGHCATEEEGVPRGASCNLYLAARVGPPGHQQWEPTPRFIASLSNEDRPDWGVGRRIEYTHPTDLSELTARVSPNGRYLAFMSERELTGYDNIDASPEANGAHDEEVFLYDSSTGRLTCASCDPTGARPRGVHDPAAEFANPEGYGLLADHARVWSGAWLAGELPGWTRVDENHALYQSRYLSSSGRLFFDSPADLVPEATNAKQDVYEYEPQGVPAGPHECTGQSATFTAPAAGCLGLISSGTSPRESAFLDASVTGGEGEHGEALDEGGGDVFFLTAEKLSPRDLDTSFDVYDAHECTTASPCHPERETTVPAPCASSEACRPDAPAPPGGYGAPASAAPGAAGNLTPQVGVLTIKTVAKPKPPTRAQRLARALGACRSEHRHSRTRRVACERLARRRYGPPKRARKAAKPRAGSGVGARGRRR
jgi:hypothetical protein